MVRVAEPSEPQGPGPRLDGTASRDGRCFPSYGAIAAKAECARSTVAAALKVLELARALAWQHRIARIRVCERNLFGQWANRWRVIRTSNAYVFRDPLGRPAGVPASKSENRIGTRNQELPFNSCVCTEPRQRARTGAGAPQHQPRGRKGSKIARDEERRDGSCHMTSKSKEATLRDEETVARETNAELWEQPCH
jgi:hypothetical protein